MRAAFWPVSFSELLPSLSFRLHGGVAKYWETIVEKLKFAGWEVRWVEAMHDGESGWTATAVRGKERNSTHANDITLAFQELEASCSQTPSLPVPIRQIAPRRPRLRL